MLALYDDKIKDNYLEYVVKMQSTLSLIASNNQNILFDKIKEIILEEIPNAKKGEEFYGPKIKKILNLILDFCIGGYLKDYNNFHENPLLTLSPCMLNNEISQLSVLNDKKINLFSILEKSKLLEEVFNESKLIKSTNYDSEKLQETFQDKAKVKEILLDSKSFFTEFEKNVLFDLIFANLYKLKDYGNQNF